MNWKRIVIGGLVAGLVINVLDFTISALFLMERYEALQAAGIHRQEPLLPFIPLWILGQFAIGLILAGLYAAVRPRLGPGPKTALIVGLVAGLLTHVPYNVAAASWSMAGRLIPLANMIVGLIALLLGALVAGFIYKEEQTE
jgi:fluoride ion exporter CrcB/FEX